MLSFATRHPPKDCFYVPHIFMRYSLLSPSDELLRGVRRKINAKLLIREFLHQITIKKLPQRFKSNPRVGRYVKSTAGAADGRWCADIDFARERIGPR